ncbi:hypothetical protein GCM10027160_26130 [Streptomyces calidiresistens]
MEDPLSGSLVIRGVVDGVSTLLARDDRAEPVVVGRTVIELTSSGAGTSNPREGNRPRARRPPDFRRDGAQTVAAGVGHGGGTVGGCFGHGVLPGKSG